MVRLEAATGDGVFASDSVTRMVYSHTPVLFGWPRAILMQLSHPLVAAGVAQHSNYRVEPLQRFFHTFDSALQIIFGNRSQAEAAAAKINAIHDRVFGELTETVGAWPAGTPYRAGDKHLLLWVHCTLVDSDMIAFEKLVRPLSPAEKEALVRERRSAGSLLRLPPDVIPSSVAELHEYLRNEIESDRIAISDFQRQLGLGLLYPAIKRIPRLAYEPVAGLTAEMLPEKLRQGYGLSMTRSRSASSMVARHLVRKTLPLMPEAVRSFPITRARRVLQGAGRPERADL